MSALSLHQETRSSARNRGQPSSYQSCPSSYLSCSSARRSPAAAPQQRTQERSEPPGIWGSNPVWDDQSDSGDTAPCRMTGVTLHSSGKSHRRLGRALAPWSSEGSTQPGSGCEPATRGRRGTAPGDTRRLPVMAPWDSTVWVDRQGGRKREPERDNSSPARQGGWTCWSVLPFSLDSGPAGPSSAMTGKHRLVSCCLPLSRSLSLALSGW